LYMFLLLGGSLALSFRRAAHADAAFYRACRYISLFMRVCTYAAEGRVDMRRARVFSPNQQFFQHLFIWLFQEFFHTIRGVVPKFHLLRIQKYSVAVLIRAT